MTRLRRCPAAPWSGVFLAGLVLAASASAQTVATVPFEAGLRLSYTVNDRPDQPDAVAHLTILSADPEEAQLRLHWMRAGPPAKWYQYVRPLSAGERRSATAFHMFAGSTDRSAHRGYTWRMLSRRVLERLVRDGETEVTLLTGPAASPVTGRLTRASQVSVRHPVLLDGRPVELAGLPVRGRFQAPGLDTHLDLLVLADTGAPWILRSAWVTDKEGGDIRGSDQLTEITTRRSSDQAARSLEEECSTTRHDILFATGSAELDSVSAPVLAGIAAVLRRHPDWQLTIVGHTDGIGTASDNLDLSRRRAEAVRGALVSDYGIPAGRLRAEGRGETRPVADNSTAAGRARNRRVDLERGCAPKGGTP
ncbi:MAG: OmpA family protein [Gemmatimonadales bacterium]